MPIKVHKVAEIIDGVVVCSGMRRSRAGDVAAVLTNLQPHPDANPAAAWTFELTVGEGPEISKSTFHPCCRYHTLTMHHFFIYNNAPDNKITTLIYFRNRLFMSERPALRESDKDEVVLRIKKAVYDEETELSSLRAAVANIEAAIEFEKSGPRRDPIPEDVKLLVWARDGGCCVRCGSKEGLHFDHIAYSGGSRPPIPE